MAARMFAAREPLVARPLTSAPMAARVQPKLAVATSGDRFEREADRAASAVTGHSAPSAVRPAPPAMSGSVADTLASAGQPLNGVVAKRMGTAFGWDFSHVRVHADDRAGASAASLGARAYAHRNHIAFAHGQYMPGCPDGDWLIAHELAHVVQQSTGATAQSPQCKGENKPILAGIQGLPMDVLLRRLDLLSSDILNDQDEGRSVGGPRLVLAMQAVTARRDGSGFTFLDFNRKELQALPPDQFVQIFGFVNDPNRPPTPKKAATADKTESIASKSALEKLSMALEFARKAGNGKLDEQIDGLMSRQSLAAMAFSAGTFAAAQLFPGTWIADGATLTGLTITGYFLGKSLATFAIDIGKFFLAITATTEAELREAGEALAEALAMFEIAVVTVALTKGVGAVVKGATPPPGPPPFREAYAAGVGGVRVPVGLVPENPPNLEIRGNGSGKSPSATPAKPATPPNSASVKTVVPKDINARIAEAEADLNPARQKTLDYQAARKAEGKSLKGGDSKSIWNVKERIWILRRLKAFPGRTILEQAKIIGVKLADGTIRETSDIAGQGRTPDFVEVRDGKVIAGDLKSANEQLNSVAGGVKDPGSIEGEYRSSSKIGKQKQVEAKVIEEAQKGGGKIVIAGKNALTGAVQTMEVDPANYSSEVVTYEDVLPN